MYADHQHRKSTGIESGGSREVMRSAHLRPVFLGNLSHDVHASDVADIFERPLINLGDGSRVPGDRIVCSMQAVASNVPLIVHYQYHVLRVFTPNICFIIH